jgi:hypothetical protein
LDPRDCGVSVMRVTVLAFSILFLVISGTRASAGVASILKAWQPGSTVKVCFIGDQDGGERIAAIAKEWTARGGLRLDFGSDNAPQRCDSVEKFHIRISLGPTGTSYSFLGVDSLTVGHDKPSMQLGVKEYLHSDGKSDQLRGVVLHYFGLALGLLNQEQDPKAGCRDQIDPAFAKNMPSKFIERQFNIVANKGEYLTTPFDKMSVMKAFSTPDAWKDGEKSTCYGPFASTLSEGDHKIFALLYPPERLVLEQETVELVTARFEGAWSPESYAFVLEQLLDQNKLPLRQHIDIEGKTPSSIVLEYGLAPYGKTPKSLEAVLCRINPHVCTSKGDGYFWTNTGITRNYQYSDAECGSPVLPRYILCLPDLEVASYDITKMVLFDGSREKLEDVVVRAGGCAEVNKECLGFIQKLNARAIGKKPLSTYKGPLRIPVLAYRVSFPVRDKTTEGEQFKANLERIVDDLAKNSGINTSRLGVYVTSTPSEPTSNQAGLMYKEPRYDYVAPLQNMDYAFGDEGTEQALLKLPTVVIGIWDKRVDVDHCDFMNDGKSIVIPSFDDSEPIEEQIARKTGCDFVRNVQTDMLDHATHIAGILAAQLNSQGVVGVNPRARLWAWQLTKKRLFDGGDPIAALLAGDSGVSEAPPVINISQSLSPTDKPEVLQRWIFGQSGWDNVVLFVAAAGRPADAAAQKIDSGSVNCSVVPACWSGDGKVKKGVLSVVALNAEGTDLLKDGNAILTNYGEAFDVGAIGVTESSFYGNSFGQMSGSSVATPYVAGLASLIFAKGTADLRKDLDVSDVKERILFTADFPKTLRGLVRFGRINYRRGLLFSSDQFTPRSPACNNDCSERPVKLVRRAGLSVTIEEGLRLDETVTNLKVDLHALRRIVRQREDGDNNPLYTVLFLSASGELTKIVDVVFVGNQELPMEMGQNGTVDYPLANIEDFVSCSFADHCR